MTYLANGKPKSCITMINGSNMFLKGKIQELKLKSLNSLDNGIT